MTGELILWDTPFLTQYEFKVPGLKFTSREVLPDLKSLAGEYDRFLHQFARGVSDFSIRGVARNGT